MQLLIQLHAVDADDAVALGALHAKARRVFEFGKLVRERVSKTACSAMPRVVPERMRHVSRDLAKSVTHVPGPAGPFCHLGTRSEPPIFLDVIRCARRDAAASGD
jgi:hypothetical protein